LHLKANATVAEVAVWVLIGVTNVRYYCSLQKIARTTFKVKTHQTWKRKCERVLTLLSVIFKRLTLL